MTGMCSFHLKSSAKWNDDDDWGSASLALLQEKEKTEQKREIAEDTQELEGEINNSKAIWKPFDLLNEGKRQKVGGENIHKSKEKLYIIWPS